MGFSRFSGFWLGSRGSCWCAAAASRGVRRSRRRRATCRCSSITCRTATRRNCGRAPSRSRSRGRAARAADGVGLRRGAARGSERQGHATHAFEPQELTVDVPHEAARSVRGPRPRGVGPARRAPADRRHQPDRRVAVLLRGAERGAAGGSARARDAFMPATTRRSKASTCRSSGAAASIGSRKHRRRSTWRPACRSSIGRRRATAATRRAARGSTSRAAAWTGRSQRLPRLPAVRDLQRGRARPTIDRVYPRFTMVGGDFETVAGPWVVRGEVAVFPRDAFQAPDRAVVLDGAIVRCRRRRRSQGRRLPRQRTGPGPPRAIRRRSGVARTCR